MDMFQLKKLIYSNKDHELLKFLDENLNAKNHSNSTRNLKFIDEMIEDDDKRFLVARLESIYENASLGGVIAGCITLFITLIILFVNIILGVNENQVAILIMILIICIFIVVTFIVSSNGIFEKANVKYYLSLFKGN